MYKKFLKTKYVIFFCFCLFFLLSSIFSCSYAVKISDGEEGFFRTGNMHYARSGHSAILLKDGRVLIVGGRGGGEGEEASWTTEIYDPKTQTFSLGPKLNFRRYFTSLLYLCEDGKVLIFPSTYPYSKQNKKVVDLARTVEVYDPKTNTISLGAKFPEDITFSAESGSSGRFYLIELNKDTLLLQNFEKTAFLYNPKNHTWEKIDKLIDYSYLKELHNDDEKWLFLASGEGVLCVDKATMNIKSFQTPEITIYETGIELSPDKYLILGNFYTKELIKVNPNREYPSYYKYHYTPKAVIFDQKTGTFNMIKKVPIIAEAEVNSYKRLNNDIVITKTKYPASNDMLFGFDTTKNEFYKKTYMAPSRYGTFTKLKDGTYLYTGGSGGGFSPKKKAYIFK